VDNKNKKEDIKRPKKDIIVEKDKTKFKEVLTSLISKNVDSK